MEFILNIFLLVHTCGIIVNWVWGLVGFKSIFKSESFGVSFFSIFYLISGIAMLLILAQLDYNLVHISFLGVLSIVASYGLNKMRRWSIFLVALIFVSGVTLGVTVLYASLQMFSLNIYVVVLQLLMVTYIILLTASFIYVLAKRGKFK